MKIISVLILMTLWGLPGWAQKKYVDPNEKQKRGLLEVGEKEEVVVAAKEAVVEKADNSFTPQQQFCECKVLQSLNKGMFNLYHRADEDEKAVTSIEDINARETNVEETLVTIVKKYSKSDTPVNPKKCPSSRFSAGSVSKMEELIVKQEKRCDVYKLRGADND